jgi:gliding motility-associated protein GldC
MKQSEIRFSVELDDDNIPEKIFWSATDAPSPGVEEAKAINVSIWDFKHHETLRIDLWSKDMTVDDMKRFVIDSIGGMASTIRTATNDDHMADQMDSLCRYLVDYLKNKTDN